MRPWTICPSPKFPPQGAAWAALGFSIIWGTVIGVAATRSHRVGRVRRGRDAVHLALTVLLYRQQAELRDLVENDPLGLINHRGFRQALRRSSKSGGESRVGGAGHARPR
jgi:hypothetical protein